MAFDFHSLPVCTPDDLHAQLAVDGARTAVLCASHRQAQALLEQHAQWRTAHGALVWDSVPITSFNVFVHALYAHARPALLLRDAALPPLIGEAEARVLWRLCIDESREPLLRADDAALLAGEAWNLCHEYRLALPLDAGGVADVERFNGWAQAYRRRLDRLGVLDAALFEQALLRRLDDPAFELPQRLVVAGHDDATPRLAAWLDACHARGLALLRLDGGAAPREPRLVAVADDELELRAAAQWARAQLDDPARQRVGVIVPDLGARRAAVQRVFDEQLCPQLDAPDANSALRPYNLTLGISLGDCGVVQTALQILQLAAGGLDAPALGSLLNAADWGDGEAARLARAALDARLRRDGWLHADLQTLLAHAPAALHDTLRALAQALPPRRLTPAEWSEAFTHALEGAQWPGTRPLDSEQFQILARWRETLLEFARLDRVLGRVSLSAAVAALRELVGRTIYQAQSSGARVQVMGVLEAQGLAFDALWVCGCDDERWPPPSRPHPFIPAALQRRRGLPHASAARELAYARSQLDGWRRCGGELVLSHARSGDGHERAASPLLAAWLDRVEPLSPPALPTHWQLTADAARLEQLDDAHGPAPRVGSVLAGGTRVLADQARCPFRGYATHRLGARPLEAAGYGLQAYDRGTLVHRVLEILWSAWRTQASLLALDDDAGATQIAAAVDTALDELQQRAPQRLQPAMRELEAPRLRELIAAWLEVERQRAPFHVERIENREPGATVDLQDGDDLRVFEGLTLRLRPDRIDIDERGWRIVLDYKTGARKPLPWADGRPEEPQLLLYALTEQDVGALAFARLAVGDIGLQGVGDDDAYGPGIAPYASDKLLAEAANWTTLQGRWRAVLATLAGEVRDGWAAVTPKHPRQSCRDCGLHALCRIREDVSLDDGEEVAT